jgi:methionine-S-sulfoxide reductase
MSPIRSLSLSASVLLLGIAACQAAPYDDGTRLKADLSRIAPNLEVALFAGGCFWCMEAPFDVLPGVKETTSGYTDGFVNDPKYKHVSAGTTGHTEAIQIVFDPQKTSYEKLLEVFWRNIDPTSKNGQFCDRGTQYRSGIYPYTAKQKQIAEASRARLINQGLVRGKIETQIKMATRFFRAEEYHHNFYRKFLELSYA